MADDKPTRSIHDNGNKHKGNVEKFLGRLAKKDREEKFEKEMVQRTLQRVERDAMKQYATDVGDPALAKLGQKPVGVGPGASGAFYSKGADSRRGPGEKRSYNEAGLGKDDNEDEDEDEDGEKGEDEHPDFDPNFDYNSLFTRQEIPLKPAEVVKSADAFGDWTVVEETVAPLVIDAPKAAPAGSSADWFDRKTSRHAKPENVASGGERAFATSIDVGNFEERDPDDLRNFSVKERTIDSFEDDGDLPTLCVRGARAAHEQGGWSTTEEVKSEGKREPKPEVVKDESKVKVEDGETKEVPQTDDAGDAGAGQSSLFKKRKVAGGNLRKK